MTIVNGSSVNNKHGDLRYRLKQHLDENLILHPSFTTYHKWASTAQHNTPETHKKNHYHYTNKWCCEM